MPTLTETIDNLVTTTWRNRKRTAEENIYNGSPFYFAMRDRGRFEPVTGGRSLSEPVVFAKSDKTKFVDKGSKMSLADQEFLTEAIYDWRYLADSVVNFGVDDQKNSGKAALMSLITAKLDNAENSLIDMFETALAADGTLIAGHDALPFHGLQQIIPDDPTTGTFGGLNSAAGNETWWRSQTKSATTVSFTASGDQLMREIFNDCATNLRQDAPDLIVSGEAPYRYYEDSLTTIHTIQSSRLADAGFNATRFKGIEMVWSPAIADTRMYFLNTRFLKFKFDPRVNFDMTPFKSIPDQINDRVAQIVTAGNIVTGRRKVHGVIHTIDTA